MSGCPLTPSDFAVTSVLRLTGPIRPSKLASTVGMRPTSLSNYLRRLSDRGLVRRRVDPTDKRAALVSLTPKGLRLTEACFPSFERAINAFRDCLSIEGVEVDALLPWLEAMSRALDSAASEVTGEVPRPRDPLGTSRRG